MRIISKHRDYYDTIQAYGVDTTSTYIRKIEKLDSKSNETKLIYRLLFPEEHYLRRNISLHINDENFDIYDFKVIFFCGKLYPLFIFKKTIKENTRYFNCYSIEDVDITIKKYGNKRIKSVWLNKKKKYTYHFNRYVTKPVIEKRFNLILPTNTLLDLHHTFEVPYFIYSELNNTLEFNPILKKYSFYKIHDTFTAYQEIDMFLSGILGGQSPKTIELSDSMRKAKHGFDKWSFKTPPK